LGIDLTASLRARQQVDGLVEDGEEAEVPGLSDLVGASALVTEEDEAVDHDEVEEPEVEEGEFDLHPDVALEDIDIADLTVHLDAGEAAPEDTHPDD
jgi:hypothetical protein